MSVVDCPNCYNRVLLLDDGTCPACRQRTNPTEAAQQERWCWGAPKFLRLAFSKDQVSEMLLLVPRCQDCAKQKPALDVVYEDFERKQVTLLGHRLFREAQERQSA